MHITVEAYNPAWQKQFLQIRSQLEEPLSTATYRIIEHIESTSVVGLSAKLVIGIDIVVRRDELDLVIEGLRAAGYEYLGERGDLEPNPPQNIYVCVENPQALKNHLLVRDVCRVNEKVRDRYGTVKFELSKQEWKSVNEYCAAKNDILAWVLSHGMTPAETDQIRSLMWSEKGCSDGVAVYSREVESHMPVRPDAFGVIEGEISIEQSSSHSVADAKELWAGSPFNDRIFETHRNLYFATWAEGETVPGDFLER